MKKNIFNYNGLYGDHRFDDDYHNVLHDNEHLIRYFNNIKEEIIIIAIIIKVIFTI